MQTYTDLWEKAAEYCRRKVSVVAYSTWIENIKPIGFNGTEFTVSVPTDMYRDVILKNYKQYIDEAFEEAIGFVPAFNIICEDESAEKKADICNEYNFSNYVQGESNRFAFAASMSVAEKFPAITYNPLVLYGNSGVGKTHLALAIYNYIKNKFPDKKLLYMRTEEFTNEVITGIHTNNMPAVRDRFRTVDVLLLDYIHFIAGKDSVQEEFFNTFNALYQDNKQIIVTCDRPIRDIKSLEDRIKSRLTSGLACDIQMPDFETRVGIIRRNAKMYNMNIDDDTVFYIAEQIKQNVRQLEGVIKKLHAIVEFDSSDVNKGIVNNVIRDIRNDYQPEPITVEKILNEVARTYSTTTEELTSKLQTSPLSKYRQIAMYVIREITKMPLGDIGAYFGRDHSTVHYAISKVEKLIRQVPREKETIEDIIKNLQSE